MKISGLVGIENTEQEQQAFTEALKYIRYTQVHIAIISTKTQENCTVFQKYLAEAENLVYELHRFRNREKTHRLYPSTTITARNEQEEP